jgi:hypothetical protein
MPCKRSLSNDERPLEKLKWRRGWLQEDERPPPVAQGGKGLWLMSRTLALGLALGLGAASPPAAGSAQAALSDSAFVAPVSDQLLPVEKAEFIYNGRQYCWYEDGWRGPGWYWCGSGDREGVGWGGAYGWNGWRTMHGGSYRHGARHQGDAEDQGGVH